MFIIKKNKDNEFLIQDTNDGTKIGYTGTAETAEKICEEYHDGDWSWEEKGE